MKSRIFNSKKIFQVGILAIFLFSWLSSANATVLCECDEGHITVENIYTGYCNLDLNHDHDVPGHSDLTCRCDDTSINLSVVSYSNKIDYNFDFTIHKPFISSNSISQFPKLDQRYLLSYNSNIKRKLDLSNKSLTKVILLI